jgi:hypothetical protein
MITTNCEGGFTGTDPGAVSTTNQHGFPMTASPYRMSARSLLLKNFNI